MTGREGGALASIRDRLEWAKIHSGAYRVEGFIVMRSRSGGQWGVWSSVTDAGRKHFTLHTEAPSLAEAMEWIADEKGI